jgi:hypothetical protein
MPSYVRPPQALPTTLHAVLRPPAPRLASAAEAFLALGPPPGGVAPVAACDFQALQREVQQLAAALGVAQQEIGALRTQVQRLGTLCTSFASWAIPAAERGTGPEPAAGAAMRAACVEAGVPVPAATQLALPCGVEQVD